MVGWHQWLNGHECEQTPRDSEGQGSWHAAVHGVTKSGHDLVSEQYNNYSWSFPFQYKI